MENTMSGIRLLNAHYVWEDFLSMGMGAVIVLTSWMVGDVGSQSMATNAAIADHKPTCFPPVP